MCALQHQSCFQMWRVEYPGLYHTNTALPTYDPKQNPEAVISRSPPLDARTHIQPLCASRELSPSLPGGLADSWHHCQQKVLRTPTSTICNKQLKLANNSDRVTCRSKSDMQIQNDPNSNQPTRAEANHQPWSRRSFAGWTRDGMCAAWRSRKNFCPEALRSAPWNIEPKGQNKTTRVAI
jgi:hypothetical protein